MNRRELFETKARQAEALLENIGRDICDVRGGGASWRAVNAAIADLREAVREDYAFEED